VGTARLESAVEVWGRLAAIRSRNEKIACLADLLRGLPPPDVAIAVAYLSGQLPGGRVGLGYAQLRSARPESGLAEARLTLREVEDTFARIRGCSGPGAVRERVRLARGLLEAATPDEQEFLIRLVLGELRQGALEGLMAEAVARAAQLPARSVRRALMLSGDLGAVAAAALERGRVGLDSFAVRPLHPLQPMLAQPAADVEQALGRLGQAGIEYKLDGARVQVHKQGETVRVFSRQGNDVSESVPELVDAVAALREDELILDGETLALRPDGRPLPFQDTMRRFGRKRDDPDLRRSLPLTSYFFDCLYAGGEGLLDREARERSARLAACVPQRLLIHRIETGDPARAAAFAEQAWARGHEGVVAKSLSAPYEAGGRGDGWLKVKRAHTLDLVVLAAEWGSGRRSGFLSNLHLGARDGVSGQLVMLGKTFKGLTDELLAWQTERLLGLELERDRWTVYVRPELVVEVAFSDVQASSRYPGGLALRFARVKGYRPDKRPEEADLFEAVRSIYAAQSA
jgi:DNA ligase-1